MSVMKLTDHFDLDEFVVSQTAERLGIDNMPPGEVVTNLRELCENVLEPLRVALGPVLISSGYRCLALNTAIGGSPNSQHTRGEAADLSVRGRTLAEVYNWLRTNTPFDQLIREFPPRGWVHVSYVRERRGSTLVARLENGRTVYEAWAGDVTA